MIIEMIKNNENLTRNSKKNRELNAIDSIYIQSLVITEINNKLKSNTTTITSFRTKMAENLGSESV